MLNDPQVLPIHTRVRWKRGRFKVKAVPDARAVRVNGKKLAVSSFRQEDELQIGSYRIFLLNPDGDAAADPEKARTRARPPVGRGAAVDPETARVQAPPDAGDPIEAESFE